MNDAKDALYDVIMNVVKDNDQAWMDKEIAQLEAVKRLANTRHRLAQLCNRASCGFSADDNSNMGSKSYKVRLALKRAKSVWSLDIYLEENQRALDDFFNQLDLVFKTKPLTYSAEKNKYVYASGYLVGIPSQEWSAEKRLLELDPERMYSFEEFKAFLQEHRLPAHIRTANLVIKIATVRQRSAQSVPQLIAYLNELENQVDPPYDDRSRRDHLFVAIHKHIRRVIVEQNRSWGTQAELEQVATSIKSAVIPPKGIKVKKGYTPLTTTTTANWGVTKSAARRGRHRSHSAGRQSNSVAYVAKRRADHCSTSRQRAPKPAPQSTPGIQSKAVVPAPNALNPVRQGPECYNCRKRGHISKDCPQPKTGLGKVQGQ